VVTLIILISPRTAWSAYTGRANGGSADQDRLTARDAVDLVIVLLGFLIFAVAFAWLQGRVYGRSRLQRSVEERCYTLQRIRWLPRIWTRIATFKVIVERDGQVRAGRAYVGTAFRGPVWSSRIEFAWEDGSPRAGLDERPRAG
jgi:hypothetical protein